MNVNLLIDTNNMMLRLLHSLPKTAKWLDIKVPFHPTKMLFTEDEQEVFKKAIEISYNKMLSELPSVGRVFMLRDSSSWRKKIDIDGVKSYKATRKSKQKKEIPWDIFEKIIDEFVDNTPRLTNYKIKWLEADDLMYLCVNRLEKYFPGDLNIIYSTDSDYPQLLSEKTVIYNPIHTNIRFILCEGITPDDIVKSGKLNESVKVQTKKYKGDRAIFDVSGVDLLNTEDTPDSVMNIITSGFELDYANKFNTILTKVICGDDKDDVPSIFSWEYNDKPKRITPKYMKGLMEDIHESGMQLDMDNILNKDFLFLLKNSLEKGMKNQMVDIPIKTLARNLKRNRILLYLSDETIPSNLIEKFDEVFNEEFDIIH